jgi:prephenate dehydratase
MSKDNTIKITNCHYPQSLVMSLKTNDLEKIMKPIVIFLGEGTFSEGTFREASFIYEIPRIHESDVIRLDSNDEIIPTLARTPGAYACIGIETDTGGRIRKTIDSIAAETPFKLTVIGCLRRNILIGIHTHNDTHPSEIIGVIGHDQALLACKASIKKLGITKKLPVGNNGIGLTEIACNPNYKNWAALGPNETAGELGLRTLNSNFGDAKTYTSFLILHNGNDHKSKTSNENRCLIFFSLNDKPGELVSFLGLLTDFNVLYIQGMKKDGLDYRFSVEIEIPQSQLGKFGRLRSEIVKTGEKVWILGPYERR